jgi:hypothetical protein
VHDFAHKLQQPQLWPYVVDYVQWRRRLLAARADGGAEPAPPPLVPLSINLDLTTACNYACDHCIDWEILNGKVRHADETLRRSLERMAAGGLRSVILIGGGEPTLYPGFADFVRFLKALGLQVAVVSNGSRNDRLLAAAGALGNGDWVRLSLDAATNATFVAMHKPSRQTLTLDEICAGIRPLKSASPELTVGFSFVITWRGGARDAVPVIENIDEIAAAAARARTAGFDYISFKPFLERSDDGSEVLQPEHASAGATRIATRIRAGLEAARRLERPGFRVLASTNLRVFLDGGGAELRRQPRTCHMQALRQVLTPHGLFNCPAHRGVERARIAGADSYAGETESAATARATAAILDRFDASVECAGVTCLYNETNWWLDGLIRSSGPLAATAWSEAGLDAFL